MTDLPPPPPPPPPPPSQPPWNPPPGGPGPDVGAALSYGWQKFSQNVGPIVGIVVAPVVVLLILDLIGIFAVRGLVGIIVIAAVALLVSMVAYIGIFNAGLMATSGQRVEFAKAYQSDRWGEWIGFAIVYGLMLAAGYLVCFVGALVVLAFWGLAPFYFLDQRMSIGQALGASWQATRTHTGLPLALAICGLVAWVGGLVCGIGSFVTVPIAVIAGAFLYRYAAGQSVAE